MESKSFYTALTNDEKILIQQSVAFLLFKNVNSVKH